MKIFAIGDLHLGHTVDKPMDIFGPQWKDHAGQIAENWRERVLDTDLVLVPGDVSWAMRFEEAEEDLQWLDQLPGRKVLLKGNHDYWWPSISRLRDHIRGTSLFALQYDAITIRMDQSTLCLAFVAEMQRVRSRTPTAMKAANAIGTTWVLARTTSPPSTARAEAFTSAPNTHPLHSCLDSSAN